MGLVTKNNDRYGFDDSLNNFFTVPLEEKTDYESLKNKIYNLDIDIEEKANMINNINILKSDYREKDSIQKEIDRFIKKYDL